MPNSWPDKAEFAWHPVNLTRKDVAFSGAERYKRGMKTLDFRVKELPEDPRLDKVIPLLDKEISRSKARALIENGSVYVNKKRCHKNAKTLHLGDEIRILISERIVPTEEPASPTPTIIFEDKDIIVVNKPPFLPTHETRDTSRHHLALAIQEILAARAKKKPSEIYLGIHHRLDRDTSGVIAFTKKKEANAAMAQAFQGRDVEKTYLALCQGSLAQPLEIKSFIGNNPKNKKLFCSVKRDGRYAETVVRSVAEKSHGGKTFTLVGAQPKTGRTHQIRVHLSENNLPILGDQSYGVAHPLAKRVLLHAWKLKLLGQTFTAPMPDDFRILDFTNPQ